MYILSDKLYTDIVQSNINILFWWIPIARFIVLSGCVQCFILIFVTYLGILYYLIGLTFCIIDRFSSKGLKK